MKEHPMKEFEYLMAPLIKCAADTKAKKKAVRKDNIRNGSRLSCIGLCRLWFLTRLAVEKFEKGCKEFKEDMFSGK